MRRKGSAWSSASRRSHVEYDDAEALEEGSAGEEVLLRRILGTDEPRKGTEEGPLSCDDEPALGAMGAAGLVKATMIVSVAKAGGTGASVEELAELAVADETPTGYFATL